jgi:tetratricopeptide (TPR) repeat protein
MYPIAQQVSGRFFLPLVSRSPLLIILSFRFPYAGHLIHMPTHIDVLLGDYESCVQYNNEAILADNEAMRHSPATAGVVSFYFGYIVHNYHMLVYGAILGGMEGKAMEIAKQLNEHLTEDMFMENQNLTAYLESYSALDIHVMVRFGRWREILELEAPRDKRLMLFRSSSLIFARGLAHANLGDIALAKEDREGKHERAFQLLREAVQLQDNLRYDEPWGKMQPIRHALGGLLLEQGHLREAEEVFREDLKFHPKNPWALVGLIQCLKKKGDGSLCCNGDKEKGDAGSEVKALEAILETQRKNKWADFNVTVACECCKLS